MFWCGLPTRLCISGDGDKLPRRARTLAGPLLAPPTAVGRQARTPSLSAAAAVACGLPSVDHAAAPFRSIRAPGPVAGPAVAPGQLVFNVSVLL